MMRSEESKVVSAYVPGLPTELPEIKAITQNPIKSEVEIVTVPDVKPVPIEKPKVVLPKLTASEILKAGVEPKITLLKDILFTFRLYPGYLEKGDYVAFRAGNAFEFEDYRCYDCYACYILEGKRRLYSHLSFS